MSFDYYSLARSMMVMQAEEITGMRMKEHAEDHKDDIQESQPMFPEPGEWLVDYIAWLSMVEAISHEEFDIEQQ